MMYAPPSGDELAGLLDKIVPRLMKRLTRSGHLLEEQGLTYLADTNSDDPLASLQAASCTYRIALGPRAGQKVLSLHTVASRDETNACASISPVSRSPTNGYYCETRVSLVGRQRQFVNGRLRGT